MKVIIAGSREITQQEIVEEAILESGFQITTVICGESRGVDTCGKIWAIDNQKEILSYPANWDKYGKRAGPIRNMKMAEVADALILIWDGESSGSANMLSTAKKKGIPIHIHLVKQQ